MRLQASLADVVPLWRTLSVGGRSVLVTPALDYVGALELGGLDYRFAGESALEGVGEALRSLVSGLQDDVNLLFLYRVEEGSPKDVEAYEETTRGAASPGLSMYARERAAWLREQRVRRARLFLFFTEKGVKSPIARGSLGVRLVYRAAAVEAAHEGKLESLAALAERLSARLRAAGLPSRPLDVEEVRGLHHLLLNPNLSKRAPAPKVRPQDDLWSGAFVRKAGAAFREYTEAEFLALEDVEDGRGYFRQGDTFRRVLTLKTLPEGGTPYFAAEHLQGVALEGPSGERVPFPYTLAVAVDVESQGLARWKLNTRHKLVDALRRALPFLGEPSVSKAVDDAAAQASIASLFAELNQLSSKVVSLSVSLLLEAGSLAELDARTEAARTAFHNTGNSQFLSEEVSQLPAFLSMLPGSGPYQLRRKGCTSRNAADFLPVFTPWTGGRVSSLMPTPGGELFRFAPFDRSLGLNAFHGLVAADTGSGKSFTVGLLLCDALAAGYDAILVDNGRSWQRLTELLGGTHIPVDLDTSISPFLPFEGALNEAGELSPEVVAQAVRFIEVCVTDHLFTAFDVPEMDFLTKAVRRCYLERFSSRPSQRPLLGDFREYLLSLGQASEALPEDRRLAEGLHRRLRSFCDEDGVYARFLNRPSALRFDGRLLCFEMERVSKDARTKKIAMAALMEAVTARAMARGRRPTIVAIDEAHEFLGNDAAAEGFLAGAYAKMRKYEVAMWSLSQKFETFQGSRVAPVIIGNSTLKLFLHHSSGHSVIARHFGFSPRAEAAFRGLQRRPGHYSDAFLMYGPRTAVVRMAPHPLAYWMLTTDAVDLALLEEARATNPSLDTLEVLKGLARSHPHGANGRTGLKRTPERRAS